MDTDRGTNSPGNGNLAWIAIVMDKREIGNLFFVGFRGTAFNAELAEFLDELNPAGVILFARNVEDPLQVSRLNRDLQQFAHERLSSGLLIGVDQEGGRVTRLREPFSVFPPALELARSDAPEESVRRSAAVTAQELTLTGFSVDFVPVLDVLSSSTDLASTVIGDRAFGFDSGTVSQLGAIVIDAMRAEGIIPCGKHFPGHGGTLIDSHIELPVDDRDLTELENSDLLPFRDAVSARVEMIMTAHVLYPSLDGESPATLSPGIIDGLLRRQIGFDGVVISDDLDMGAVAGRYSIAESSVRALGAGVDLLLICNQPEKAFSAREALVDAIREGQLTTDRVRVSLARVNRLKALYGSSMRPCDPEAVGKYFASRR
jgi:beta-N-acetylhexosaminidase